MISMEPIPRSELPNRREFGRYRFQVAVEIEWRSKKLWGRATDISRTGMFIEVADPPCVRESFKVRLALNLPLQLDCVVRRIVAGRGIGVSLSVGAKEKRRFEALLLALGLGADPVSAGVNLPQPEPPRTMVKSAGTSGHR
jgi:PilZ domain